MEMQESISPAELERKLGPLDRETYTAESCERFADTIAEVKRLKRERRAVILAHNYQRPEIFEVADFIGDSFELARKAREVKDADVIVFCGVHFMAETAKVFNPDRKVLMPDFRAGCSLAESVTAEALADRRDELLQIYPDLKVVSYVNCTADVKAVSDACCTSANAAKVVNAIDSEHILFVPDQNLANYVQTQTAQADHFVGRQLLRASSDNPRRGQQGQTRDSRDRGDCASGVPQGRAGARRRGALDQRDDALCEREPGRQVPDRDGMRTVGSAADGNAGQAFLQGVQALPLT